VSLTGWFSTLLRNLTPSYLRATKSNRNNQCDRKHFRPSTNRYQYVCTYVLPQFFPALARFTREDEGTTFSRSVDSHLLNDTFTSQKTCILSNFAARPSHVSRSNLTCAISFCLSGLLSCDTV